MLGIELRRYAGATSNIFYSGLVPASLAVDLQAHLGWVMDRLGEDLGVQSRQIPDIYLAGNHNLLQQLAQATGGDIGFEDGYYRSGGANPGIYMRTDFYGSGVRSILTHEYTHLVLREAAQERPLPAWLNEGMATASEYQLGLAGAKPDAVKLRLYRATQVAKEASLAGSLLGLTQLENQANWNSQTNGARINLQYAEAYMAVRFMAEVYGDDAPINVVRAIGRRSPLAVAILEVTGSQYDDFRERFAQWLRDWEDPIREVIRDYIGALDSIVDSADSISDLRAADLGSGAPRSSRIQLKRALVSDAKRLKSQLVGLTPPATLTGLHQDASDYLDTLVRWFGLELTYFENLKPDTLAQANGTIPEVNAREFEVTRAISTVFFVYNLQ